LIITAAIFAIILQMTSFLLTQTFFASSLESLVRSQWRLLSYQEWREVRNGITAGWVYFPNIDDVCIRNLGQIIETARARTLNSTDINFWGMGTQVALGDVQVSIGFKNTAWLVAFICMISVLVPLAFIALIARVPLKRQIERSMLFALARSRETNLRLTNFEKTVAQLTDDRVRLQKEAAVASATQMLAHDVRKPFSMLKMTLEMLRRAKNPEAIQKILSTAQHDIGRATASVEGLIQDVMDIGSKSELALDSVQVDALIHAALVDIFRIHHKADVNIDVVLCHSRELTIDSNKVMRVFLNIIGNGIQAMNQRGRLWIRAAETKPTTGNTFIEFVIGNNGPFIPFEDQKDLFEAFFTKNKKGGTGLGLAIAKKVVAAHGGKIWCESNESLGVEFHFTLPAGSSPAQATHEFPRHSKDLMEFLEQISQSDEFKDDVSLEQKTAETLTQLKRPLQVLVVDDEAVYRNALIGHLNGNKEHASMLRIVAAKNSMEAQTTLKDHSIDLAILDVDLGPVSINGFDLLSSERKNGWNAFVCIHTNRVLLDDNRRAMEAGADVFFPKPMTRQHILKLVIQAANKSAQNNATTDLTQSDVHYSDVLVAVVDDDATVQIAWEMQFSGGKVISFDSPKKFLERATRDNEFVGSLTCVVTDLNFDGQESMNGLDFGAEIKKRFPGTVVLLSSNATVDGRDFSDAVDTVIPKGPVETASELREIILRHKR
jgi:signal transduction histidine kinase/FixJ family two-component response regulator